MFLTSTHLFLFSCRFHADVIKSYTMELVFVVRPMRKRKMLFGRVSIESQLHTKVTTNKIPEIPIP